MRKLDRCVLPAQNRLEGLNQLRVLAALMVFIQHTLSSCHLDNFIDVAGFRIGRIGTAIFFLLGGFLSGATTRQPLVWIKDRLAVLFPAYWVVTIAGFIMAAVTRTKSFDAWQVVSQLAGIGYFTHGDHIVNIATWFMSPLLMLYAAATLSRMISLRLMVPLLVIPITAQALRTESEFSTLYCHAVTFLMAFAVASVTSRKSSMPGLENSSMNNADCSGADVSAATLGSDSKDIFPEQSAARRLNAAVIMAGSLLTLSAFNPEFRYGAIASLLLIPALVIRRRVLLCNWFSGVAYEWFLVHGLCLAIVSHLTDISAVIACAGAVLSVVASVTLKRFVSALTSMWTAGRSARKESESVAAEKTEATTTATVLSPGTILRVDHPRSEQQPVSSDESAGLQLAVRQIPAPRVMSATDQGELGILTRSCL